MADTPWVNEDKQQLIDALEGLSVALRQNALVAVDPAQGTITGRIQEFADAWGGVLALLFMAVIVYVLWRTMKMMPRTKPVQIKPTASREISWDEIAGVDEAKGELKEVVDFL